MRQVAVDGGLERGVLIGVEGPLIGPLHVPLAVTQDDDGVLFVLESEGLAQGADAAIDGEDVFMKAGRGAAAHAGIDEGFAEHTEAADDRHLEEGDTRVGQKVLFEAGGPGFDGKAGIVREADEVERHFAARGVGQSGFLAGEEFALEGGQGLAGGKGEQERERHE